MGNMKKAKATRRKIKPIGRKLRASNTSEILTSGLAATRNRRKEKVNPKWSRQYEDLVQLREYLLNQREHLAKDANDQNARLHTHMADSGTDSFDRDFTLSLLSSEQNALYEIEQALNRIRNGNYGTCELTGKPIPRARLDALPWTRFTVEAQRIFERDGTAPRARLGEVGAFDEASPAEPQDDQEADEKSTDGNQGNAP